MTAEQGVTAKQGTWVSIKKVVLEQGKRADNLPEQTRNTPFIVWVKGRLQSDSVIGEPAQVLTKTGRLETGELADINPFYDVNYGEYVDELQRIGDDAREILFGGGEKNA